MKLKEALVFARSALSTVNAEDSALEAEVLLRHALGIDRTQLYLRQDEELTPEQEARFRHLLARRTSGIPLAYVVKHREFYGLDFYVNQDVLIPRPETELLVEKAIDIAQRDRVRTVADIGTGSGIIAVTLALKLPEVKIYSVDVSEKALAVALYNAERHGVVYRITFLKGDLVQPLPGPCGLIVANLPYVKREEIVPPIAAEPHTALDGGRTGLEIIERFIREVKTRLSPNGTVLMEIGRGQGEAVKASLFRRYPEATITIYPDLAGIDRVVEARIP